LANEDTLKSYMYFWFGQLFSLLGSLVVFFAISVWIADETRSPLLLSLASFINLVPLLIITPFAGVISDRLNRKAIILVVDSLQAYLTVLLTIIFILDSAEIWIVFIFLGLRSTCQAFHNPTVMAILPSMVPQDKLGRVNGIRYLFLGIIQFIGPAVGATLLFFAEIKYLLWIDVITFFIALVPLIALKLPQLQIINNPSQQNSFVKDFKEGFKVMRNVPGLLIIMLIAMLLTMLTQPLMTLSTFYIKYIHGGNNFTLAIIQMIMQGGMILGALIPFFKKRWKNKMRILFIGMIVINIGYIMHAIAPIGFFPLISAGAFVMGFIMPVINIIVMTVVQITVPHDKMGRVSSILNTLMMIGSPLGAILAGTLSEIIGVSFLYLLCAITGIFVIIIPYYSTNIRHIDYDKEVGDSNSFRELDYDNSEKIEKIEG
jgi:DHA3 family macrolide efflux protein-like MFS transporter